MEKEHCSQPSLLTCELIPHPADLPPRCLDGLRKQWVLSLLTSRLQEIALKFKSAAYISSIHVERP